jgi:hypothetical protein
MKKWAFLVLLVVFLVGCAGMLPTSQTIEVTRQVEVTRVVTLNPEPVPAHMFFPEECLTRQPGLDFDLYDWLYTETIGGCSFISSSPDGQTLAYSAMVCLEETGTCGEAIKVLIAGAEQPVTVAFAAAGGKKWVGYLGWSSTGELVFTWDDINSGVGTYILGPDFVEDLTTSPATAQFVRGELTIWNSSKTAFFTNYLGGNGWCDIRISGYDFNTGQLFPDIPVLLGLDETAVSISYAQIVMDHHWHIDTEILLLITPQEYDAAREDYFFLPTLAGKIALTSSGPVYTTLASDAGESYYFGQVGVDGYEVRAAPYEVKYCQEH